MRSLFKVAILFKVTILLKVAILFEAAILFESLLAARPSPCFLALGVVARRLDRATVSLA